MNDLKKKLYELCIGYVQGRMDEAKLAIDEAQQAAGEETKSSAGDKYETSREMIQQETDRNMGQLNEAKKLLVALSQLAYKAAYITAEAGSLVITNNGNFFIAISSGAFIIDGKQYFAISSASPIGLKMKGLKAGDKFDLNGKQYEIRSIS